MKILFVCSAGDIPEIGTGHFVRMFAVANQIKSSSVYNSSLEIHFTGIIEEKYVDLLTNSGFFYIPSGISEVSLYELFRTIYLDSYQVIVFDVLDTNLDSVFSELLLTPIVITLDNFDLSLVVDLQLFSTRKSPIESKSLDLIFFPEPNYKTFGQSEKFESFEVFCSFGGFDSNSLSSRLVNYLLDSDLGQQIRWKFMVSNPEFLLSEYGKNLPPGIEILDKSSDFLMELGSSDLALVSGGLTMFQSLYLGCPSIVIPQYDHQNEAAVRMQNQGACLIFRPPKEELGFSELIKTIDHLRAVPEKLTQLRLNARLAVPENNLSRIAEIFTLYELLAWDSEFFGFPIARIHSPVINQRILDYVLTRAEIDGVRCLYYLDSGQSFDSLKIAQENNFSLVDTRITFEKRLNFLKKNEENSVSYRLANLSDSLELENLAANDYLSSRYFFDRNFDSLKCQSFYVEWIRKSISGNLDDFVLVHEVNGRIAGYITAKLFRNFATIGLVGVRKELRGLGIGKKLIQGLEAFLCESDIPLVRVVTQGRNIMAQRLYSACGYSPINSEYWFHRWEIPR